MTPSVATFDLDRLRALTAVRQLEYRDTVDSTNTWALALARDPQLACPALVLAAEQTAGRGRGTNRWHSSAGALTFSRVLEPPVELPRTHWPRLALTAAVSICRVLADLAPAALHGIRWPNDVYSNGRKVAGILVEIPAAASLPDRIVLGIGLNVNNSLMAAPPDVQARATSLADLTEQSLDLTTVLVQLLAALDDDLSRLVAGDPALPADWQARCLLRGRTVELEHGTRRVRGNCHGAAADGSLSIDAGRGPQNFYAGVLLAVD